MQKIFEKYKKIIAVLVLVTALTLAYVLVSNLYASIERASCNDTLTQHTTQLAESIVRDIKSGTQILEIIRSDMEDVSFDNPNNVASIVSNYEGYDSSTKLEIVLPGDKVVLSTGEIVDAGGVLSFDEMASKGKYISDREADVSDSGKYVVRNCVPIQKNSETRAILCGVTSLSSVAERFDIDAFDGKTQMYVIDGTTGEFLMDTWHESLGNVHDFDERHIKEGDFNQTVSDIKLGGSGNIVFRSEKAGEKFYSYFMPTGINNWTVMLSVPESVAFARLHKIQDIFYRLALFQALAFIIYFIWVFLGIKREVEEKESQLDRVKYMFTVEKTLRDVHLKSEHMWDALDIVAHAAKAEQAFLLVLSQGKIEQEYVVEDGKHVKVGRYSSIYLPEELGGIWNDLVEHKSFIVYEKDKILYQRLGRNGSERLAQIKSVILSPIEDIDGRLIGVLGVCRMRYHWKDARQLECVSLSFANAINNIKTYKTISDMGLTDGLTGLLNRNSYNDAVCELQKGGFKSLACVYIDLNGLHDVNNNLGHEEGDKMLCFVARALRGEFSSDSTFRIGGDEFVVLCKNCGKDEIIKKVEAVKARAAGKNYYISAGIEWRKGNFDIREIINLAEDKMREEKRSYYRKKGNLSRMREMNRELEKMISRKKDSEVFLSIIADNFKGVYIVNMLSDSVRHIFIPEYFNNMLLQSGGKFSAAVNLYAQSIVASSCREKFLSFCDYENVERQMDEASELIFTYKKADGVCMNLKIFKLDSYSDDNKETLWIFEGDE